MGSHKKGFCLGLRCWGSDCARSDANPGRCLAIRRSDEEELFLPVRYTSLQYFHTFWRCSISRSNFIQVVLASQQLGTTLARCLFVGRAADTLAQTLSRDIEAAGGCGPLSVVVVGAAVPSHHVVAAVLVHTRNCQHMPLGQFEAH